MLFRTRGLLASLLTVALVMSSAARAQITAFWQPVPITPQAIANDPQLAAMQCWDLKVMTSGNWASAGMRAVLPPGNLFYKHFLGGRERPNPAFFAMFPALEFTSYTTTPFEGRHPAILGGWPENQPYSQGDATATVPGTYSVSWGDLSTEPPGTYQIARLTFPSSVFPNVINIADVGPNPAAFSNTSQVTPDATVEIPDIPEPASVGLLLAASALARRRQAR